MPAESVKPILTAVAIHFITYYVPKLCLFGRTPVQLNTAIDDAIPFVPAVMLIYTLIAFGQWTVHYVLLGNWDRKVMFRTISAEAIAKTICMIIFIILPTTIRRPEVGGDGLMNWYCRFIFYMDTPQNLFPSIHCLQSWFCMRSVFWQKKAPRWYQYLQVFVTVIVCVSTVLVKQHFVVDIFAGILAAEIGIYLMKKLKADEIAENLLTDCEKGK